MKKFILLVALFVTTVPTTHAQNRYETSGFILLHAEKGHPLNSVYFNSEKNEYLGHMTESDYVVIEYSNYYGNEGSFYFSVPRGQRFKPGFEYKVDTLYPSSHTTDKALMTYYSSSYFNWNELSKCTGSFTFLNYDGSTTTLNYDNFIIKFKVLCGANAYRMKKAEGTALLKKEFKNPSVKRRSRKAATNKKGARKKKLRKRMNKQ